MDSSGVGWRVGSSDAACPACRPSSGAAQPAPLGPSKARESWAAGRETLWGHIMRLVVRVSMAEAGGAVRRGNGSGIEVPAVSPAGR